MNFEEIGQLIPVVNSVCKNVKDLVPAIEAISKSTGWLKNKSKATTLQEDVLKAQENIRILENYINVNVPKLVQLIKDYARVLADVRIARSISDKAAELTGLIPELAPQYISIFISQIQNDVSRVETGVHQLPSIDNVEFGKLLQHISVIRDLSRDLKRLSGSDSIMLKNNFDNISTYYSDIEPILTKLLDKILAFLE